MARTPAAGQGSPVMDRRRFPSGSAPGIRRVRSEARCRPRGRDRPYGIAAARLLSPAVPAADTLPRHIRMPYVFDISPERNAIVTNATGTLEEPELIHGTEAMYRDSRFDRDRNALMDFSSVETWRVQTRIFARLGEEREFSDSSKTAFFAPSPFGFGMGRVYQGWSNSGLVEVFRVRIEALAWLNAGLPAAMQFV